jgi:flagellar biosynthesis/type III secretory pathway M-ring protein FliF/YscJ
MGAPATQAAQFVSMIAAVWLVMVLGVLLIASLTMRPRTQIEREQDAQEPPEGSQAAFRELERDRRPGPRDESGERELGEASL